LIGAIGYPAINILSINFLYRSVGSVPMIFLKAKAPCKLSIFPLLARPQKSAKVLQARAFLPMLLQ
jgi:hypothetical protein